MKKNKVMAVLTTAAVAAASISCTVAVAADDSDFSVVSMDESTTSSAVDVPADEQNGTENNNTSAEEAKDSEENTESKENDDTAENTEKVNGDTEDTEKAVYTDVVSFIKENYTELKSFTATIPFGAPLDLKNFYIGLEDYDWAVEDEEHFIMTSDGLLTMVERGYTTAYAYDTDTQTYYSFSVVPRKSSSSDSVDEINNSSTIEIKVNQSKDLYSYVNSDIIAGAYTWSTEDEDVCEVTSRGVIKGVDDGDTYVKAYYYDSSRSYKYKFHIYVEGSSKYSSKSKTTSGTTSVVNSKKSDTEENEEKKETTAVKKSAETETKAVPETKKDFASEAKAKFSDISHRAWALESIGSMVDKGFIVGVSADTFLPDNNCTRADFAIVVSKMFSLKSESSDNYTDVLPSDYFAGYTAKIKAANADAGVFEGNFRPRDYVTREEAFTFVYKSLLATGKQVNTDQTVLGNYADSAKISSGEYKTAIAALLNANLITGTSAGIEPDATITRAQMAVLLNNVYNALN